MIRGNGPALGRLSRLAALLGLVALSLAQPDQAAASTKELSISLQPAPRGPVPVESFLPHYLPGKGLTETWNYRLSFPGDYLVNCQFMITNIGPGAATGLVIVYILTPDGDSIVIKNSRKRKDWRDESDEKKLDFRIARHELRVDLPTHELHVEHDEATMDLELKSTMDPIQPERLLFGDHGWYQLTLVAPRLEATGTLELPGGEPLVLTGGRGIATHSVSNLADAETAVSTFRFDSFDGGLEVSVLQLTSPEEYGFQKTGFLLIFEDNRLALESASFERKFTDLEPDPDYRDYHVPRSFSLDYQGPGGALQGSADLRLHLKHRQDILSFVNSKILRLALKLRARPIFYQCASSYEFVVDSASGQHVAKGTGFASLYLTKKPPANF